MFRKPSSVAFKLVLRDADSFFKAKTRGAMWTTERTLSLIEALQSAPCLWDARCPDYKNRPKKKEVLETLASDFGLTHLEVDRKIHALKTQFRREHNKFRDSLRSGGGLRKCLWFGYEPLLFLVEGNPARYAALGPEGHSADAAMKDDAIEEEDWALDPYETGSSHPEDLDHPSPRVTGPRTGPLKSAKRPLPQDPHPDVDLHHFARRPNYDLRPDLHLFAKRLSEAEVATRDEHQIFGQHVANVLRNCGRPRHDVSTAQHKIADVLFDLEMGVYGTDASHRDDQHQ